MTWRLSISAQGAMYEVRQSLAHTLSALLDIETVVAHVDDSASNSRPSPPVQRCSAVKPEGSRRVHGVLQCSFTCDLSGGLKTSLHLEQRDNRGRFAAYCSNQDLLDLYAGAGGFGLHALKKGAASVTAIDASEPACAALRTTS